jgi:hypothetical protein
MGLTHQRDLLSPLPVFLLVRANGVDQQTTFVDDFAQLRGRIGQSSHIFRESFEPSLDVCKFSKACKTTEAS